MAKISKTGTSHGVILPVATMAEANLSPDDEVTIATVQDGVFITARHSATGRAVQAMQGAMDQYADTFRTLAQETLSE